MFESRTLFEGHGRNLEQDVLPVLARRGGPSVYQYSGFWKSMDTSKDQNEQNASCASGRVPQWMVAATGLQGSWLARALHALGADITVLVHAGPDLRPAGDDGYTKHFGQLSTLR